MKIPKTDMIFDGLDAFIKVIVDFINDRYKITKKVDDFKHEVTSLLYKLKRNFIRSIIEGILIGSGLLALIVGTIIFANRFLPIDLILVSYGLLIMIIVLWQIKLRP